jgi:hypothetical protein
MFDYNQCRCVDTMRQYVRVIEGLPGYLEAKVKDTLGKAKDVHLHSKKLEYLRSLLGFVSDSVSSWTTDLQTLVDSKAFDFLELKPLLSSPPEHLIHRITRRNNLFLLM